MPALLGPRRRRRQRRHALQRHERRDVQGPPARPAAAQPRAGRVGARLARHGRRGVLRPAPREPALGRAGRAAARRHAPPRRELPGRRGGQPRVLRAGERGRRPRRAAAGAGAVPGAEAAAVSILQGGHVLQPCQGETLRRPPPAPAGRRALLRPRR